MKKIDLVVIGAGLYVCGKGTAGYGTVMPAVLEWKRQNSNLEVVHCAATSKKSAAELQTKVSELSLKTGVNIAIDSYPKSDTQDQFAYKEVIKSVLKPACAIIAVPDHLHYQIAKDCLEAGLHVLLVKPFTPTLHEGQELAELATNLNLYGAVEFHKRWDKSNLILRDKIKSGVLGTPINCWIEYSQRKSVPISFFKDWAAKTSILQYLGVHYIDVIRFVTGALPKKVMAIGQKSEIISHGIDAYDAIQCIIDWEMPDGSHFTETILTSWVDPETSTAASDQKIKFVGSKGRYEADQKERGIRLNNDELGVEHINPDFCMPYGYENGKIQWRGYGIDSITTFLDDILKLEQNEISLQDLQTKRPSFQESLISTAVIEAAHLSLENDSNWQSLESWLLN